MFKEIGVTRRFFKMLKVRRTRVAFLRVECGASHVPALGGQAQWLTQIGTSASSGGSRAALQASPFSKTSAVGLPRPLLGF